MAVPFKRLLQSVLPSSLRLYTGRALESAGIIIETKSIQLFDSLRSRWKLLRSKMARAREDCEVNFEVEMT
jgi:hypothetical protein